jgi:DNA gyrase/topoisomerase IV subunit B
MSKVIFEEETSRKGELEVKCMDLLHQILLRPDTYIGSVKRIKYSDNVWVVKDGRFVQSKPTYSEGLLRIFVEIMSNSIDNVWRSKEFGVQPRNIKICLERR